MIKDNQKMKDNHNTIKRCFAATLVLGATLITAHNAAAHGTITTPPSRVYTCFQEGPENPRSASCRALVQTSGTQGLYDWNGINQLPDGNHRAFVPDGQLCGGGKASHAGLNLPRQDWQATNIAPNQNGEINFTYRATAPHSSRYHRFYITKSSYNASRPLTWDDLESQPFCDLPSVPLENGEYRMSCPFPSGSGKQVIYHVWQRDDSPEAFYACVDVNLPGNMVPTDWQLLDRLNAAQELPVNTIVTLRLFDPNGQDAERHSVTLGSGMTNAASWAFSLAQEVNRNSSLVNIGQLNGSNVTPVRSAQGNNVYVRSPDRYRFAVDIDQPTTMPTPVPPSNPNPDNNGGGNNTPQTPPGNPGGNECPTDSDDNPSDNTPVDNNPGGSNDNEDTADVDFNYPDNRRSYTGGTVVRGEDGNRYECKPHPFSGWCGQAPRYYAPGTGLAWRSAWIRLDSNAGGSNNSGGSNNTPDTTSVDFNYPDSRSSYTGGTTVRGEDGNRYECKPHPFSGWCSQAPRYYAPGTGLAWRSAWIRQ